MTNVDQGAPSVLLLARCLPLLLAPLLHPLTAAPPPPPPGELDEEGAAWMQQLFATCLSLHDIPAASELLPAVSTASQMAAALQIPNPRTAAVPLLAACLKDVSPMAVLYVAACLD
jgi:hypothetical protein